MTTRLGLISDTHDNLPLVDVAARFLGEAGCDLVLHLGDITGPATVRRLAHLPLRVVRGNNDTDPKLPAALASAGIPPMADTWRERVGDVDVGATHGHLRPAMRSVWDAQLVLHGHTHRRRLERHGDHLFVNPGALHRAPVKTLALVELPARDVRFYEVRPDGVVPFAGP